MTPDPLARSLHGGADELPLPDGLPGSLWLCGKHFIGPDPDAAADAVAADVVVCLNERHELVDRYPDYVAWADRHGDHAIWFPIHDFGAPSVEQGVEFADALIERLRAGQRLLMHCGAGMGRTGTIAAAVLIRIGTSVDDAIAAVAAARPMSGPEAGEQRDFLEALADQP